MRAGRGAVSVGRLRCAVWRVVEVTGESMLPALRAGDLLLVRTGGRPVRAGDVVVAAHPRKPATPIVKRAVHRDADGWWLESDNQRAPGRQDSWDFGAVPERLLLGRVVARYWPPSRLSLPGSAFSRDGAP
ncbi:nickel-type superoxide dismutase maturation protease [Thermomonospora umbrina]|uniref:nickel-type superoxide dismutase maturation protease n=1 Tax=Thermomonospora umbrina TaxID=111806 RepID=UPI003CCC509B